MGGALAASFADSDLYGYGRFCGFAYAANVLAALTVDSLRLPRASLRLLLRLATFRPANGAFRVVCEIAD